MDQDLPKPAKYLVHMPGVDGPIWRVRLVVSRVVWCFIEASKTQIFRRIDFWSFGVLLYVMCASSMFLRIFRIFDSPNWQSFMTCDRLCGRLPFEIEGTSRSQLHVDVRVSFGGFSLAKTQHGRLKFFSSRSRLWKQLNLNLQYCSMEKSWRRSGYQADYTWTIEPSRRWHLRSIAPSLSRVCNVMRKSQGLAKIIWGSKGYGVRDLSWEMLANDVLNPVPMDIFWFCPCLHIRKLHPMQTCGSVCVLHFCRDVRLTWTVLLAKERKTKVESDIQKAVTAFLETATCTVMNILIFLWWGSKRFVTGACSSKSSCSFVFQQFCSWDDWPYYMRKGLLCVDPADRLNESGAICALSHGIR